MVLLIVDDEELTRQGVISSIDTDRLGITEVYQADDGLHGLEMAERHHPDIILCDVRMPRMDGITMLSRIEEKYPDTVVVFMSGYSDKEYLKAAIQLKAIDYIEKPIEQKELQDTLAKAVEQCKWVKLQSISDEVHETTAQASLAYRFTMPYQPNKTEVDDLCRQMSDYFGRGELKYVTSIIVKLRNAADDPDRLTELYEALSGYLTRMNMHVIYTEKKAYHIVFFVYGDHKPEQGTLVMISEQLGTLMAAMGEYYIAVGDTVCGKENVYHSYENAVILLQNSFFAEPGTVFGCEQPAGVRQIEVDHVRDLAGEYMDALEEQSSDKLNVILDKLGEIKGSTGLLEGQLKALFYDMLLHLYRTRRKLGLSTDLSIENQETIMDLVEQCFAYTQMHEILVSKTENFLRDINDHTEDNPTIRLIREYISDHYSNTDLSVKQISDHAALSTSYACTFFKNETGMTLNQYITDFRMKKAKQLLADPRNRVSEISAAVGYSDGNYFAKSFRKYTGLSPSEYREQVVRS